MKNPFVNFIDIEQLSNYSKTFAESVATSAVSALDFDGRLGNRVLVLSQDRSVSILNLEYRKIEASLKTKNPLTSGFFVSELGTLDDVLSFVIADAEGILQQCDYNTQTHKLAVVFEENLNGKITQLRRHPIQSLVFGLLGTSEWFMYDVQYKKLLYKGFSEGCTGIAVHPDGHIIGLTDRENKVRFIDLSSNSEILIFQSNIVSPLSCSLTF